MESIAALQHHHQHVHQGNCCSHDHSDEIKIYQQSTSTKLQACDTFRINAQALFEECQFIRAKHEFQRIIVYLDYTFPSTQEEEERCDLLRTTSSLNMCVCAIKLNKYREAISLANHVLREDKNNAKALYCRGKARRELGETEQALQDLNLSNRIVAGKSREVLRELDLVRESQLAYMQQSKDMARGMFTEEDEEEKPLKLRYF